MFRIESRRSPRASALGLFIVVLLLAQVKYFVKVSIALPWWAYTFPVAALTIATSVMLKKVGGSFFAAMYPLLLTVLIVLVGLGKFLRLLQATNSIKFWEPKSQHKNQQPL